MKAPFLVLVVLSHSLFAQQQDQFQFNPRKYVCYKTSGTIVVDGRDNEADWQSAPWTEEFTDIEGSIQPAPLHKTQAKMLWDDEYFYVFAKLEEPDIWATYDQRDAIIFHENDFEVFIDPDGDTHLYYELEINALGTVWDLLLAKPYRDGGPAIDGWDIAGLKSAVHVEGTINNPKDTDSYWTVELAFPWKALEETAAGGRKPVDGDQWRINFSRVNWRLDKTENGYTKSINPETGKALPEFNWVWSDQGKIAMHQPETWGFVQFSVNKPGNEVAFSWNPDEDIKWKLRTMYYDQKSYFNKQKKYNSEMSVKGYEVQVTDIGFVITHRTEDYAWHITEDGKVWKTKNE